MWPPSRVCTSRRFSPWLDYDDGTGGVAADRRRRPAQEDIEKAALAMRAKDQAVDPERLGGGHDQLTRIPHLEQRRDRGLVGRLKPLKGGVKGLYAFRINDQYRARFVKLDEQTYFILVVGDFH
jgi:hypothetical protein